MAIRTKRYEKKYARPLKMKTNPTRTPPALNNKGMTLVEMLTSMAIFGALMALMLTGLMGLTRVDVNVGSALDKESELMLALHQMEKGFARAEEVQSVNNVSSQSFTTSAGYLIDQLSYTRFSDLSGRSLLAVFRENTAGYNADDNTPTVRAMAFVPPTRTEGGKLSFPIANASGQIDLDENVIASDIVEFQIDQPLVINSLVRSFRVRIKTRHFDSQTPLGERLFCPRSDIGGNCQPGKFYEREIVSVIFLPNNEINDVPFSGYGWALGAPVSM